MDDTPTSSQAEITSATSATISSGGSEVTSATDIVSGGSADYPEIAPVSAAVVSTTMPADQQLQPYSSSSAAAEPAAEIPASGAEAEQPVDDGTTEALADEEEAEREERERFMARPEARFIKRWVRDELELMQLGKSREQRETVLNP